MQLAFRLALVIILGMNVGGCLQPQVEAGGPLRTESTVENRVPGEYLVGLAESTVADTARELFSGYGVERWQYIRTNTYLLQLQRDPGPATLAKMAQDNASLRYVEPNRLYTTQ